MHPPHQPKSNDFDRKNQPLFRIIRFHFGMHSPPTDLNVTNPAKNQSHFWWRPFFFFFFFLETTWFWAKKKRLNFRFRPKNQPQFWWRPFFFFCFFFFWRPPDFWAKKTFEFPISAEKSLSILVKTSEFLRFCASNPLPPKFSGSATVLKITFVSYVSATEL